MLKCHLIFISYQPGLTSVQHTTSHTTAVQSPSHCQWYIPIGKLWYQLPEFWSPRLDQHLRLHSTCHLHNKTYPLTPDLHWPQYQHLCPPSLHQLEPCNLYKQMTSSFVQGVARPLHFLCTHLWHLVHCIELLPTWPSYSFLHYRLPFSTNHK